jgi:hypothetical protein
MKNILKELIENKSVADATKPNPETNERTSLQNLLKKGKAIPVTGHGKP